MIRDLGPYVPKRSYKLNPPILAMLLNAVHDRHEGRVFVLQVGAGNGETGLPLLSRFRDDGWSGLLIEPLPQNFAQLEALYHDSDRVAILNLGISDVSANLQIHSLTPEAEARNRRGPRGRASLHRDRIARPGVADEDVQEAEVPVLRMDIVLEELGIDTVQLLVINAGGHEEQVLAGCDLAALDPSLIFLHTAPDSPAEANLIATLTAAGFIPFLVAGWLVGLAPGRLAVPLEELLTFFNRGIGARQEDEE
ncbi:FkbM family methyltransferase [Rhodobacter sp. SY28-1]|uniref:FkbM family methyltransferase n=1 Tax=Rhodobacter sp. SY28-1 TaxID=2562317 RepID=UPI0014855280|nr:FkbM family methyltransferase [Rhodobacter sp. SY28-1]